MRERGEEGDFHGGHATRQQRVNFVSAAVLNGREFGSSETPQGSVCDSGNINKMDEKARKCGVRPCHPLKSLKELQSFRDFCCSFERVKNQSTDARIEQPLPDRPRVLLCHDMAGGYLEDRYYCTELFAEQRKVSGDYDPKKDYRFDHWDRIDIFVYFSHNFITVPPCKWTQEAHANGVKMLGTIIIEWKLEVLQELLDPSANDQVIENLVDLCVCGNFDGWLLNMEVKGDPDLVTALRDMITTLRKRLLERKPGSLVLWYDSLVTTGKIAYQNELNQLNKPFFDDCDGIFLNYGWNERSLGTSKATAGERVLDVYVGIDVFGRQTGYTGGFNTPQVAKEVIDKGLSVAIFAPGWVLECNDVRDFSQNQEKFWGIMPVLR
ncbi:cytosolic endo-beta-N-acetylglucosaminidase [Galendromus occidentalis]|uniref:Cytosolic endo-beta-N-acetylglucosaminidase n=1 Tax=Galendromus occidentalis TaxID=34638 RepID=A0AAJ7L5G0_9ACAR|nr:cytosolic endo-beta-N-acetylglucosaminidase [Galendromus occidentalis]